MSTIAETLTDALRHAAHAFASGDQVAPCAVLWPDPQKLWEPIVPELQATVPELYVFGKYDAARRTGPALWLRCIEARMVDGSPPAGKVPIFYLPGVSRQMLRAAEDCTMELAPLVELQYRGVLWTQPNGREWTPHGYLTSTTGGLGLNVLTDQPTHDALAGALGVLTKEPLNRLQGKQIDAEFLNGLLAPDAVGLILRWFDDPDAFRQSKTTAEWKAFAQNCKKSFKLDPAKDGPLKAAKLLAEWSGNWGSVWKRFAEAPMNHPGVVEWLKKASPKKPGMLDSAEAWPMLNEAQEKELKQALEDLADKAQNEVIKGLKELEERHGVRRSYPWARLDMSPLAKALEPLAKLAERCAVVPGAPSAEAFAAHYAETAWETDAAAMATLAACRTSQETVVTKIVRAVYLPWLEATSRQLQAFLHSGGHSIAKRTAPIGKSAGRVIVFADGLRMDVARLLAQRLAKDGIEAVQDWDWSTVPSVTATAKPAVSPVAGSLKGKEAEDEFATRLTTTDQLLTHDRFKSLLMAEGWQFLKPDELGDVSGSAWTETGGLDKRGHTDGWKLAHHIDTEVREMAERIMSLLHAGWTDLTVVTDHGWLSIPGGLPKVELSSHVSAHKWGRCAALKADAQTDLKVLAWHWNPKVAIASPPGAGCYVASMEYSHGGVSLQEMVIPVLRIGSQRVTGGSAGIAEFKWTGAKCVVKLTGDFAGCRVDVRTRPSDPATSLLTEKMAKEPSAEGKVTVFLEEDSDIGREAEIVLLDRRGQVIDSVNMKIGN